MNKTKVRYLGGDSFSINGNVTGRLYHFSHDRSILFVDPRDAEDFREIDELQVII